MNISTTLNKAVKLFPNQVAVIDGDLRLTYQQVAERVEGLALGLSKLGLKSQECISIVAPNNLAFFEVYYAASKLGLIVNPINVRLSGREMAFILNDAGSRLVLADIHYANPILEAIDQVKRLRNLIWLGAGRNRVAGKVRWSMRSSWPARRPGSAGRHWLMTTSPPISITHPALLAVLRAWC